MRILAPRKRDSITGEEVVVAVTNAVVTSTRRSNYSNTTGNNNNNNNSTPCNNVEVESSSVLVAQTTGSLPQVDFVSEKVLNKCGAPTGHQHCPSSFASVNYRKEKLSNKSRVGKKAGESSRQAAASTSSKWRNRIGNSVHHFLLVFNTHCCAVQEEKKSSHHNDGRDSIDDKNLAGSVTDGNPEKSFHEKSEERTVITSEESLPLVATTQCSGALSTSDSHIALNSIPAIEITESIHVENTTKPSDKPLVAAVSPTNSKIMRSSIYHEKQVKSLCALHALNNLLQDGKAFRQEDLDKICSELDPNSWVNPHKSVFGLGNYDINVIMTALQQKKLEAVWFDKRKDPSEELNFDNIYGFILNIPSDCRLGWLALPIKRKHWVAIRNLPSITEKDAGRSNYYNLDSKFDKPESIGTTTNLIEYLRGELKSPEKELFLVVTEDIGKVETWRKNPPPPPLASSVVAGASVVAASGSNTHLLPVPTGENGSDAAAGSGNNRRTSNDSGVVDLLPDLRDINVVDLNKEDLMRRQSSGVWSDLT